MPEQSQRRSALRNAEAVNMTAKDDVCDCRRQDFIKYLAPSASDLEEQITQVTETWVADGAI